MYAPQKPTIKKKQKNEKLKQKSIKREEKKRKFSKNRTCKLLFHLF